jgi:16S rRNA G966 N2-methylase RsmD
VEVILKQESRCPAFIYTFACHEEERPLCHLELRTLFGLEPYSSYVESLKGIDPSRSPFVKARLEVMLESDSLDGIADGVKKLTLEDGETFKVLFMESGGNVTYEEQRAIERQVGLHIRGKAEMRVPAQRFGIMELGDRWAFGHFQSSNAVWLHHNKKPQQYSTALSTRVARAVVNIAVPEPEGVRVIDPCCGIGTIVIEALSMGIDIIGSDRNPLAVKGARLNLAHFNMPEVVSLADMRRLSEDYYDALILDLPYNLCSVISDEEKLGMLVAARSLAARTVIITVEPIDELIAKAGFAILDRGLVNKGKFSRQVILCSSEV